MVTRDASGNSVRLNTKRCSYTSGWLDLRSGSMIYQGKSYEACWTMVGDTVLIFDSAGDISAMPASQFRRDDGV